MLNAERVRVQIQFRIRIHTANDGYASRRPKNLRIRIHNTASRSSTQVCVRDMPELDHELLDPVRLLGQLRPHHVRLDCLVHLHVKQHEKQEENNRKCRH
jgi:hypothetical protein